MMGEDRAAPAGHVHAYRYQNNITYIFQYCGFGSIFLGAGSGSAWKSKFEALDAQNRAVEGGGSMDTNNLGLGVQNGALEVYRPVVADYHDFERS